MGLKCADVGHLAAGWDVHKRWVDCLEGLLQIGGVSLCRCDSSLLMLDVWYGRSNCED